MKQEVFKNERSKASESYVHSHDHRRRYSSNRRRALGISALVALAESAEGAGLLYASSAIIIVSSIIEFIAGIKGVGACSAPQKAAACVKWGIVIGILYIASMVIGLIGGGQFSIINLVLNLLLPGLYSYGAVQMKNNVNV